MRKNLQSLLILMAGIMFYFNSIGTATAQVSIPNGRFEDWTSQTFDYPTYYPNSDNVKDFYKGFPNFTLTKATPGYNSASAAQVTTLASGSDTSTGYFVNFDAQDGNPLTWHGGVPYNQTPTGIRGYYKNSEIAGDSGLILVAFSHAGTNIGTYYIALGGVHSSYTLFTLTFNPPLYTTPDSVAFGVTSSYIINNVSLPGSTLTVDSISFTGVTIQPTDFNGDFELWSHTTLSKPNNWNLNTDDNGDGIAKTTDSKSGSAIELTTFLGDNNGTPRANAGSISTGHYPDNCSGFCTEQGGFPFTNQTDTLEFWYKYAPMNNDSAIVNLSFKQGGTPIGGAGISLAAASGYTHIELPFSLGSTPDSVTVDVQSSTGNDTTNASLGSDLKIDEIHFKSQPINTGVSEVSAHANVMLYPNPVKTFATLAMDHQMDLTGMQVRIYDVVGRVTKTLAITDYKTRIGKDGLSQGVYFYEVRNNNGILKTGKLVIE